MKFAHKLVLAVVVILALSFSVIGYLTISRNFSVALDNAITESTRQHLYERYSLETELVALRQRYSDDRDVSLREQLEALVSYVGDEQNWQALYDGENSNIFTTIPAEWEAYIDASILDTAGTGYVIQQNGEQYAIFISSQIENRGSSLKLVSAYVITTVYTERDRQIHDMLWMDAIVMLVAVVAVAAISYKLTKPIRKLNRTSKKIARGAYNSRTNIVTDDEIGELSENFNLMAQAVETQVEQLNLSVQQREDFVSAFTHEVKTPMTAIIGYSDILRFQQAKPELQQRAAHFIYREANRLESLSQKLLLLMGLSDEQAEICPVPLDTLFRDAARSVFPVLQDKGIEVKAAPADGVNVLADRDLVVDLLRNLLLNAVKAEPKDNAVWLQWKASGGDVVISVLDRGKGIPAEELSRITEPFYMVEKSRTRREGGSGVGLALCQRICELHNSSLEFQSEVGKGTMVSFVLSIDSLSNYFNTLSKDGYEHEKK